MDYKDSSIHKKPASILQGADEFTMNKILARESSVGQSSRIYYRGNKEGVPFKWEMQPGTAKSPPREEIIPPPTPPPSVQSLAVPQPNLDLHTKESKRWRLWLWTRSKRSQEKQKALKGNNTHRRSATTIGANGVIDGHVVSSDNEFESFHEFGDSDGEFTFTTSAHDSRSSSASSSSSTQGDQPRLGRGVPGLFCGPWQY